MDRGVILKIQILRQLFLLLLLLFLHQGTAAAAGSEGQLTACEETAWLTFSTHDLELVAKEHENATVLLQARGSFNKCLAVNFTYDPANPSVEPLDNFTICPVLPASIPRTSTASPSSRTSPSASSASIYFSSSAAPHLPPSLPFSSSPPSKRCRGCGAGREDIPREAPLSTPIHPHPSPLQPRGRVLRGVGGAGRASSSGDVVANVSVEIVSRSVGKTVVGVTTNSSCVGVTDAFVRVSVIHTRSLDVVADVVGWVYTILWDVSFFPQVWLNWRRKSVEGFSLDNVTLNFIAYLYYTLFNVAFFYVPYIKEQFKERYPRSVNHVQANDVFFASYALFMDIVLAIQCFLYGRKAGLSVSWACIALVGASVLAVGVECVLVAVGVLWWLDVFYLMSYLKLAITPLKYIPQVYVNYQLKSTEGFSVFGATMDFSGGVLSLAQMFLLSANSNDFVSVFTNFSKFGLGIVTLVFDIIYFGQHWYYHLRHRK